MFCIRIADLAIKVENKYAFVEEMCRKYIISCDSPDFSVFVTDEEIAAEATDDYTDAGYLESVAIYRKICEKILPYDAFLLHAAVVAVDGKAYAFSAHSGVGKSTHIGLWRQLLGDRVRSVNGDKPIIRFVDGVPIAYGTPWSGKEGLENNISVPLSAVCLLSRGEENSITPASPDFAATMLLGQVVLGKTADSATKTMELLDRLIGSVSLYSLRCTPTLDAAKLSYKTLTGDFSYEN